MLTRLHEDAVYIPLTFETNKALYTSDLKGVHFGTDQYDVTSPVCTLRDLSARAASKEAALMLAL